MISIATPVYNEEKNISELVQRIKNACEETKENYEIIIVDDGSSDNTLEYIKKIHEKDKSVNYISLSRNYGHQGALWAGLDNASGDAVITLDGDLQHPPELIVKMVDLWRKGYEVVYTVKNGYEFKSKPLFYFSKLFYSLISKISDINLSFGQSDFRLLDKKVVKVVCDIPEKNKFMRGLVDWVGFKQTGINYTPPNRKYGESKFKISNYVNFALDGIFAFSIFPMRLLLWAGLILSFLCLSYAFIYIVLGIINFVVFENLFLPPGWASIVVSITLIGGIQLIGLGLMGEYISRIYLQTKRRPDYIIRECSL